MKNMSVVALLILLITGCSAIAPKYNTDFNNISQLRKEKLNPARVGTVTKEPASKSDVDSLAIRGASYASPYGSYTAYLAEALKEELDDARLLDPMSQIEVSAVLLRNSLNAGLSTGEAEIEARFVVRNAGTIKFDKVKVAQYSWESSFFGAVAIPKARENYSKVVQKLIGQLFSDPEFISALK
jgi:hypothetical protein